MLTQLDLVPSITILDTMCAASWLLGNKVPARPCDCSSCSSALVGAGREPRHCSEWQRPGIVLACVLQNYLGALPSNHHDVPG